MLGIASQQSNLNLTIRFNNLNLIRIYNLNLTIRFNNLNLIRIYNLNLTIRLNNLNLMRIYNLNLKFRQEKIIPMSESLTSIGIMVSNYGAHFNLSLPQCCDGPKGFMGVLNWIFIKWGPDCFVFFQSRL